MMVNLALIFSIALILGQGYGINIPNGHKIGEEGVPIKENTEDIPLKFRSNPNPMMKGNSSMLRYDVCFSDLVETWYCPDNLLCCHHLNPLSHCCDHLPCCGLEGLCCPADHPKCCTKGIEGCCPPNTNCCKGIQCCPDLFPNCCGTLGCCPPLTECNADKLTCCPKNKPNACAVSLCCEDGDCCGKNCGCETGYTCCNDHECCEDATSTCCPEGCSTCVHPWYGVPCEGTANLQEDQFKFNKCPTPGTANNYIYRILREDESCDIGLFAQRISGQSMVTPKQHLSCGDDASIFSSSPYITFSSDLENLNKLVDKFPKLNLTIAKVDYRDIPLGCKAVDLTNDDNRKLYIQNDKRSTVLATNWCPILIECGDVPLPCLVESKKIY